eukprot:11820439-Alexandrium_andersonii.AAC.1
MASVLPGGLPPPGPSCSATSHAPLPHQLAPPMRAPDAPVWGGPVGGSTLAAEHGDWGGVAAPPVAQETASDCKRLQEDCKRTAGGLQEDCRRT